MINAKYADLLFALFMAIFMSGLMSFVVTLFNIGLIDGLLFIWLRAWGFAFCVAFPTIVIVAPIAKKLVAKFVNGAG